MRERATDLLIKEELNIIKKKLETSFQDPFPSCDLLEFVSNGSKFIRSRLCLLYLKAQGVEITEDVYEILCAGELIHNASLLHDDVIDNADTRRGQKTISKELSSKVSILAGDYLLATSFDKLLLLKNFKIFDLLKETTLNMCKAELEQFFLRGKIPTVDSYIAICKGKTAGLFSALLEISALLSKLNIQNAKDFGEKFGIYFQIKNDLNKESASTDLKNGIYTAIDILGIEKTGILLDNQKKEILNLIKDFPDNIYKKELEDLVNLL